MSLCLIFVVSKYFCSLIIFTQYQQQELLLKEILVWSSCLLLFCIVFVFEEEEKCIMLIKIYWVNIFSIFANAPGSSVQPQLYLMSHLFIYRESKNILSFNKKKLGGKTNIWIRNKGHPVEGIQALYVHAPSLHHQCKSCNKIFIFMKHFWCL